MKRYEYDGPVMQFDTCIQRRWTGFTYAPTERKARCNLAFQYKKNNGRLPNANITLPGELTVSWERENTYGRI